jgi:predicted secreted protein
MANVSKQLIIKIGGKAIAQSQSFSFNVQKDMVDITTFDSSQGWKQFVPILKEGDISFDALTVRDPSVNGSYGELLGAFLSSDASVAVEIEDPAFTTKKLSTSAYLQALNLSSKVGEVQTYSGTLKPTGVPALI